MECLICGGSHFECIHKGTRDVPGLNVVKCVDCGMVQLDTQRYNTEQHYIRGGMLKNSYGAIADKTEDMTWDTWMLETKVDNDRRYNTLKKICCGKSVLEFGCGNGGFLRRIKDVASSVAGVELMEDARNHIQKESMDVYETLDMADKKYDVVCMFMVIEHLNSPDEVLGKIYDILAPGGILICETPNAEDALISKYKCTAFEDFTYWSEHVFLFNSDTLQKLLCRNRFQIQLNTQIQRYSLANHLYWLSKGKPGGHVRWGEFNEVKLNELYAEKLIEMGTADTLWTIGKKQ